MNAQVRVHPPMSDLSSTLTTDFCQLDDPDACTNKNQTYGLVTFQNYLCCDTTVVLIKFKFKFRSTANLREISSSS